MDNVIPYEAKAKPPTPTGLEPITAANYDERVLKFAQASSVSEFPTIRPGSPEWLAWERYFDRHLHWRPWIFKAVVRGEKQVMTVPTQWPEWFDSSFVGGP